VVPGRLTSRELARNLLPFLVLSVIAGTFGSLLHRRHGGRIQTGVIRVDSGPQKAEIFFDGRFLGVTPAMIRDVPYGQHALRVEKYGYSPVRRRVQFDSPEWSVRETLERVARASLTVSSISAAAAVHVDGKGVGLTPVTLRGLAPGQHNVVVGRGGFEPHAETVLLAEDEERSLSCELKPSVVSLLEDRANEDPGNVLHHVQLAHQYILTQDFEAAVRPLSRALRLIVDLDDRDDRVRWVREEVQKAYTAELDYGDEDAVRRCRDMLDEILTAAVKASPTCRRWRKLLTELLRDHGRWNQFLALHEPGGIALDETDPSAIGFYAEALTKAGRTEESLGLLQALRRRHKRCWQLSYALGSLYRQRGESLKARIKFRQALLYCREEEGIDRIRAALSGL